MLEINAPILRDLYELPKHTLLAYNAESTQICANGKPLYTYLSCRLQNPEYTARLLDARAQTRKRLLAAQTGWKNISSDDLFHCQMDYELLAIDHLVDHKKVMRVCRNAGPHAEERYRTLLAPSSGRTFFEEVRIAELECKGHLLLRRSPLTEESFYFEMKGFEHFVERSMTREKLKAIVLEHPAVMGRMRARYGMLEQAYCDIGSAKDAYAALKEARRDQMARRYGWRMAFDELRPEDKQYVAFVGAALDYNEDNRLLRSASFYRIMHDKTFPRRFHALIQGRKHGTK